MSVERASGLILRTRPLTETSLIVHWLTPESGRLATVARGALRPKSPFRGKLDLFYAADFTFQRSRRSTLHALREVGLRETHPALRNDFQRLRLASYAVHLIEWVSEEETPVPELFALLAAVLAALDGRPAQPTLLLAFELQLLAASGLQPDLADSRLSEGSQKAAGTLLRLELTSVGQLKLTPAQTTEIRQFLTGFLTYHLGRIPRGRAEALAG